MLFEATVFDYLKTVDILLYHCYLVFKVGMIFFRSLAIFFNRKKVWLFLKSDVQKFSKLLENFANFAY
jgi:hypothetical protein